MTEDENERAGFKILGKRIGEVPCLKDSYFYGICSGLFGGFGYFMCTSRIRQATNFGMGVFVVSTLSYWTYCRINYTKELKQVQALKEFIIEHANKEGTEKNDEKIVTV